MNAKFQWLALPLLAGSLLLSTSAFAHHAGTVYDRDHPPITLTGTVTDYQYTNPHVHILFDVKETNGTVTRWTAEYGPPHGMYRQGWTRESLKTGDTVTITGFPYKDGKKMLDILKLVGPGNILMKEKDQDKE